MQKILLIFIVIAILVTIVFVSLNFSAKPNLSSQLRSLGYEVKMKETTFRGYKSQNISAERDGKKVLVQTVNNVKRDTVQKTLAEFTAPILDAKKDITIFDPYTAQEVTLIVPEDLKPLEKETTINGQSIEYYLVNANIIFSLRVYSQVEIRYRGLFAIYFCENNNTIRTLQIYYPIEEGFNEEQAVNLLLALYCD